MPRRKKLPLWGGERCGDYAIGTKDRQTGRQKLSKHAHAVCRFAALTGMVSHLLSDLVEAAQAAGGEGADEGDAKHADDKSVAEGLALRIKESAWI